MSFKKNFAVFSLILLPAAVSLASAETLIKFSADSMIISGSAPAGTSIDALITLIPDPKINKASSAQCKFSEDEWSPNDNTKVKSLKVIADASGKYSLSLPVAGLRAKCAYIVDDTLLTISKGTLYQLVRITSETNYQGLVKASPDLQDSMVEFKGNNQLSCTFDDASAGFCDGQSNFFSAFTKSSINLDILAAKPQCLISNEDGSCAEGMTQLQ